MFKSIKRAALVAALAAGAMTGSTVAEARDGYDRGRGGDTTGAAIAGGIIGLALGAAIASSGRDRYDDERYYDGGYYYGAPRRAYRGYPRGYGYDGYPRDYHRDHYRDYRAREFDRRWGRNWNGNGDGYRGDGYRGDAYRGRRYGW